MFYSPGTAGFYDRALHGDAIPEDAVEITREEHQALMLGQSQGKVIVMSADRPVLQDRPAPPLPEAIAAAQARIDRDTDRVYTDAIGNRADEYRLAEAHAMQFQGAGFVGDVPAFVADHAAAKGCSPQQAAEEILETASTWRAAQAQIRANRLLMKEQARNAADAAQLQDVLSAWSGFVSAMRTNLGIAAS